MSLASLIIYNSAILIIAISILIIANKNNFDLNNKYRIITIIIICIFSMVEIITGPSLILFVPCLIYLIIILCRVINSNRYELVKFTVEIDNVILGNDIIQYIELYCFGHPQSKLVKFSISSLDKEDGKLKILDKSNLQKIYLNFTIKKISASDESINVIKSMFKQCKGISDYHIERSSTK